MIIWLANESAVLVVQASIHVYFVYVTTKLSRVTVASVAPKLSFVHFTHMVSDHPGYTFRSAMMVNGKVEVIERCPVE